MNRFFQFQSQNSRRVFILVSAVFILIGIFVSALVYAAFFRWGLRAEKPLAVNTPALNAEGTPIVEDGLSSFEEFGAPPKPLLEEPPAWDGTKRVTVLVMGIDYRDWESGNKYSRTDTMMLLTIDPVAKTAGALSIPRDMWAAIPGFKPAKINTAHYFGDLYNYPGGGPALAIKTVENMIGVPIDYYVRLDFYAFVDFIDFIDGVKVDVEETIELEIIGQQFDTVLTPGRYTLNGKQALAYARNRYNEGGDFDRARRQQQIIMGIRDRMLNPTIWGRLIANAPELYNRFSKQIATNMPFDDAIRLAALAVQVKEEDIQMAVIGLDESNYGRSPDDLSILIPYPDEIRRVRDQIFETGGAFTPAMSGDPETLMQVENSRIVILDGAADGGATAERTASYLRSLGLENVSVRSAGQTYNVTSLIDHTGSPYAMSYLADLMNVGTYRILHRLAMNSDVDVEIWLGTDWQYNNSLP